MNKIEKLLNELCPNGVEFKNLWEIGELSNTGVDKKIRENQKEVFLLNFLDVMNNHYINKNIPSMKVTASEAEIQKCNILKNDLFITPSSENINEIGFASVAIEDMPNVCYSYHIMRFRIFNRQINPYFLRYCFDSENLRKQILKNAQGITRFGLTQPKWKNLQIPIPPLEIQEEIVKILDTFTELEAELEARRRQYEYYRNKLLSFEYLKTNGGGV
ncbi:restriction endonuclease subunit S [Campylobacter jejuni]|nr:restriction endonuclease subunit S [Campylobacter jejuni]EAH5303905.1 restriction endonuclease subunit S [Campylobacter jejuni]EAI0881985.1 restriction endonuclease subunit S [Campylobacter jejuni]EAJ1179105.1 restriction endonuclease subunit S [Campylobacter jejuni]EAK1958236.1 restriction endonuclease subunit S [Campylobacter jejuni]